MKKYFCILLTIIMTLSLIGCGRFGKTPPSASDGSDNSSTQESTSDKNPTVSNPVVAVSVPSVTIPELADDGTTIFRYTYQHMVLFLNKPEIADKITVDFLNRVDQTTQPAETLKAMAKDAYNGSASWTPYLYHITYSPMRIDNEVLSLFGNNVVYSGAGHPEKTCVSASYDLLTGDVLTLASIMNMNAKAQDFCDLVLDGLSEIAQGNYLYNNYKTTVTNRFNHDLSLDEAWYFSQTGLCFYFVPYEIAPYSSGVISVEIPYEKLKGIVHDAYLPAARDTTEGTVTISPFEEINLEDLSHMSEIVTDMEGKMYMATTSNTVQDVRIIQTDTAGSYTVYAAYELARGDGIMIQSDADTLANMKITYKSNKETISQPII